VGDLGQRPPGPRRTALEVAFVCLVGAALFMPAMWAFDLRHPLEPQYAQTAHEIVAGGDWLVLHRNGEPYYNKPPLFFWLEALGIKAFGLRTVAVRLPSAALGIGSLVLCYLTAGLMGAAPLASSLVLATSWGYVTAAQRVSIDATLSFLILLALYLYMRSDHGGTARWAWFAGAALAAAAAVMAKGPVALLILVCAVFPYLIWRRRWAEVLHWKWAVAFLVVAAISVGWLVAVGRREGPAFYKRILGTELISRMDTDWEEKSPFYRYVLTFPTEFLPWVLYLPAALTLVWKRRNERFFQALLWLAAGFIALTLMPAKMERYLVPLCPPAAIVVGAYLAHRDCWAGLVGLAAYAVTAAGVIVGALVKGGDATGPGLALGIAVLAASCSGLLLWRRFGFRALVAVAAVGVVAYTLTVQPYRDNARSPKPMAAFLKAQGATADQVVWFRDYDAGVAFYAGFPRMRRVNELASLHDYSGSYVIARAGEAARTPEVFRQARAVGTFRIGSATYLVFKTPLGPAGSLPSGAAAVPARQEQR